MGMGVFVGGSWIVISLIGLVVLALGVVTAWLIVARLGGAQAKFYMSTMPYATTAMLALFLGFMASDIWSENRSANDTAGMERLALERLVRLAELGGAAFEGLPQAIADYRSAVIEQEWGINRNVTPAKGVSEAIDAMWRIALAAREGGNDRGLSGELVAATVALETQREIRLNIGRFHDHAPWIIVFVLAYFSCCSFALAHLDRPRAARVNLMLFVVMTLLVFVFLALFDGPYEGFALPPTILER